MVDIVFGILICLLVFFITKIIYISFLIIADIKLKNKYKLK